MSNLSCRFLNIRKGAEDIPYGDLYNLAASKVFCTAHLSYRGVFLLYCCRWDWNGMPLLPVACLSCGVLQAFLGFADENRGDQ